MMMLLLIIIHEKCSLSLKKDTMCLLLVCVSEGAFAVHFTVLPLTRIHAAIRPLERTVSVTLIVLIVALVNSTVWPSIFAPSMHVACVPLSNIFAPIEPFISPVTLHLIVHPVARIECTIWPEVSTKSIFLPQAEMTIKPRSIRPAFNTLPMVQVIFPLSYVALLAVLGLKVPEAIRLIILPVAFVGVTIGTPELSLAIRLVIEPFSFVLCPIWPLLLAICTLFALLVHVARIICIFRDL